MTVEELKDVIVYLQGRVEELESKKLCECASEPVEQTKPTVTYVTNYDEDDECLTCSAELFLLISPTIIRNLKKITKLFLYFFVCVIFWLKIL